MKASRSGTVAVSASQRVHNTGVYMARHWQLYLIFILPAVVLTLIFKYMPMGGILIAFQDYNPFQDILGSEWVGLEHFQRFMSSPDFQRYLVNTLKLSVYGLLWGFPVPIILAFLLNRIESKKIKQKIQLVLYMPNFISVIVLCGMVRVLLSVTGPLNGLLHTSINFMTIPEAFRPIYIISGIWQGRRLVLHHVHGLPLQCQQGPEGSGHDRRRKPAAADHDGRVARYQGYGGHPVHPPGRQHHEHRL